MRAAIHGVDGVRERENVFAVGVVVLQRDFDFDRAALSFDVDRRIVQGGLAAVQMFDELGDAARKAKLGGFFGTFIRERDFQAFVQKGQLAQALGERVEAECRLVKNCGIGMKRNARSGLSRFAGLLQLRGGLAFFVGLFPNSAIARDFQFEPV